MLYLITSNDVPIKSVHEYTGVFELSLLHQYPSPVMRKKMVSSYDIFVQDESSLDDGLNSSHLIEIETHESPSIFSSLEEMAKILHEAEQAENDKDEHCNKQAD